MHSRQRTAAVLVTATALALLSIAGVTALISRASSSRDAHLKLAAIENQISNAQALPWTPLIRPDAPQATKGQLTAREIPIERGIAGLAKSDPAPSLDSANAEIRANFAWLEQIRRTIADGDAFAAAQLLPRPESHRIAATRSLREAGRVYNRRAAHALTVAALGSGAVIILLACAFSFFYVRSNRARAFAQRLASEREALAHTDALTGLGNRRALMGDLEAALAAGDGEDRILAIYDLDGFKHYNDTFGHPAGDALLARLGDRLVTTLQGIGTAYRMGGDEFCILASGDGDGESIARLGAAALSECGEEFEIGCSFGIASLPAEVATPEGALALADRRMYAQKHSGRVSASRQSTDVLLKVLSEQSSDLGHHIDGVARLAQRTAELLGLGPQEAHWVRLAAELHDVGKTAIPEAILSKPGPLNDDEWAFMRRHTLIGERIILAAPALAPAARLVRSSHERVDGKGYPDGLRGDEIPLGSRIVSICDAFDAMVSERPYSPPIPVAAALAELQACAGGQFDADIVATFVELVRETGDAPGDEASALDAAA